MKNPTRIAFSLLLAAAMCLLLAPAAWGAAPPPAESAPVPPAVVGRAAVMINADDGRVLYSKDPDEHLAMASTTKMMTALLIIEDHAGDLDVKVTCSQNCAQVGESSIYLTAGEQLTVRQMLMGLLIPSGNDAAVALAEFDAGSIDAFVAKMNRRAQELGLTNTHFINPHGLDEDGHYTCAADFAKLARELMKHPEIRDIVNQQQATIPGYGSPTGRLLINTNTLLGKYPGVNGIKTGYTDNARECLMVSASGNGVNLIVSYLGGPTVTQRDEDITGLLNYGFAMYRQQTVIAKGKEYKSISVPFHDGQHLALVSDGAITKQVCVGDRLEYQTVLPDEIRLPIHAGDKVGLLEAFDGNQYLGSAYLVATRDVGAPGLAARVTHNIHAFFNFLLSAA